MAARYAVDLLPGSELTGGEPSARVHMSNPCPFCGKANVLQDRSGEWFSCYTCLVDMHKDIPKNEWQKERDHILYRGQLLQLRDSGVGNRYFHMPTERSKLE